MLKVENLNVHYGKIHAIKGIDFEVNDGEIVTLIGANGAGKSTTLKTLSGLLRPTEGTIVFDDQDLTKVRPSSIPGLGIAQVPEGRQVFAEMSVLENLTMGAYIRNDKGGIESDLNQIFD